MGLCLSAVMHNIELFGCGAMILPPKDDNGGRLLLGHGAFCMYLASIASGFAAQINPPDLSSALFGLWQTYREFHPHAATGLLLTLGLAMPLL